MDGRPTLCGSAGASAREPALRGSVCNPDCEKAIRRCRNVAAVLDSSLYSSGDQAALLDHRLVSKP